jgi:acyl-CoA synthetase (AMP-forming)/AMP-acid ligase II
LSGVAALFFPFFNNGLRVITKAKFNPNHFGRISRNYKVTATICSVESSSLLLKSPDFNPEDFSSMREFLCGGERVPCNVREFLKSRLPRGCFGVAYGTTESGIITNFDREADTSGMKDNVVGNIRSNVKCMITDIDTKEALGINQVGEIRVKTETMFSVRLKLGHF